MAKINYNGKAFEFNTKVKIKNGVFKGIEGELVGVNEDDTFCFSSSDKPNKIKARIRVDTENTILVDFNDIERTERTYIIYTKEHEKITRIVDIKILEENKASDYIRKLYRQLFGDVNFDKYVVAEPLENFKLKIDNVPLTDSLSKALITKLINNKE